VILRLLITGASGLLGASLINRSRDALDVIACAHQTVLRASRFEVCNVDLVDAAQVDRIIKQYRPDWICHSAALTNVDLCQSEPALAYQQNVHASINIAKAGERHGSKLLLISTDSVFSGEQGNYVETDHPLPINVYAQTKLESECRVQAILSQALIARVNFYGWNIQAKHSLAEWVLKQLQSGSAVSGWTDVYFTPLFTNHLADLLLEMVRLDFQGIYHVGGSERVSKYDFARAVAEVWGYDPARVLKTKSKESDLSAPRPGDTSMCCDKLSHALKRSLPDLRGGLNAMRESGETDFVSFKQSVA
jgi:dTDP-4-dehydrorhamnose reductase